jgi:hypothetical protein
MHMKQFFMSMIYFEDKGIVVMVSKMSGLDMDPIEIVVMANFLSPGLSDMGVFPFVALMVMVVMMVRMGMLVDSGKVLKDHMVDGDFFVCHLGIKYII